MKSFIRRQFDRLERPVNRQIVRRQRGDSYDLGDVAFLEAAFDSVRYQQAKFPLAKTFANNLALLTHAMSIRKKGLVLEFGVASGRTIKHLASLTSEPVYGFDSFEGLPEPWYGGIDKGAFAGPIPKVPSHVHLICGLYSETLPEFLREHSEEVSLIHVDCDLYSSTAIVFQSLSNRVSSGCIIVFDEYFNYPGWRHHEFKAFQELVSAQSLRYHYDSFVPSHQQVCVVID
jgi:methyltransferase family protein